MIWKWSCRSRSVRKRRCSQSALILPTTPDTGKIITARKLARDSDGKPLLWVERRHLPLLAPPGLDLSFDDAVRRAGAEPLAP